MITITDKAAKEIQRLLAENDRKTWGLRIGVKAGGCSGLEYDMDFAETEHEDDHVFENNGVKVMVDLRSFLFLNGLQLDYVDKMIGGGFKFNNPNAERTCSCGTSFSA
jgi:iron-sulfur cluster assembly protein